MTQKNIFRSFVALSLAFTTASIIAGIFPGHISEDWKIVLEWNGNEGLLLGLAENIPESGTMRVAFFIAATAFVSVMLAVQIGMFLFWRFARISYLLLALIFVLLAAFDGLIVMTPLEASLNQATLILDGVIIGMAYLPPVNGYFESRTN